jgi:hypothetical protein
LGTFKLTNSTCGIQDLIQIKLGEHLLPSRPISFSMVSGRRY